MSAEAPEAAAPSRGRRPQILVLAALLAVVIALTVWLAGVGRAGETARGPAAITAALAQQMRVTLERLPPQGHAGHGGAGGSSPVLCGTRVYGFAPADAASVEEVDTVYGFHMCAVAEPGRSFDWTTKMVAPLVMRLGQGAPKLDIAESANGVSYQDRVRQLFPPAYRTAALTQALEPAQLSELRRRYAAVAGPVTGSAIRPIAHPGDLVHTSAARRP